MTQQTNERSEKISSEALIILKRATVNLMAAEKQLIGAQAVQQFAVAHIQAEYKLKQGDSVNESTGVITYG